METNKPPVAPQPLRNQRSDDFASVYSNNVAFEASAWDLKLIFGQLDQAVGVIDQRTALTIPWSLAKLALYHLKTQLVAYEIIYGKIVLSHDVLPPAPQPLSTEQKQQNPAFERIYEAIKILHEEFVREVR
jgi:hypothetical protein